MEVWEGAQLSRIGWLAVAACSALLLGRLAVVGATPAERPVGIVDLHVDLGYQHGYEGRSFATGTGQYPAGELLRAGVVGVVLPLFVPYRVSPTGPRREDLEGSYGRVFTELVGTRPYALPGCVAPPGVVRTWLAFEGAAPLAKDPGALARWVAAGVRSVGLVHTRNNALAGSSGEPAPDPPGLTAAGRTLVHAAHALGVAIDVSHASRRATLDVLAMARAEKQPVIATHSNARALADHPRNLDDEAIRGIAATGGVIGVNLHSPFLARGRPATLADVVRHIRYLVRVAGVDHVALGSDFEGDVRPPAGLPDVRALPRLAAELERSGFSREAIERVLSKNALRILCRGGG